MHHHDNNESGIVKKHILNQFIITAMLCGSSIGIGHTASTLKSGVDLAAMDRTVNPKDDFYHYVNGNWIKTAKIPEDQALSGAMAEVSEKASEQVGQIIQSLIAKPQTAGSAEQKIVDFYHSYMNTAQIEQLGASALNHDFQRIEAISNQKDLARYFAYAEQTGLNLPFSLNIYQDTKASSTVLLFLGQGRIGLKDREDYLSESPEAEQLRKEYLLYIANLLNYAGDSKALENARTILALEKALAKIRWTSLEMRNLEANYYLFPTNNIKRFMPEFDWMEYFQSLGFKSAGRRIALKQVNYLRNLNDLWKVIPLETWKAYLKYNLINSYAPYLSDNFKNHRFQFYQQRLLGVQAQANRDRQASEATNAVLGELIAPIYVARYFDPAKMPVMQGMIENVRQAFKQQLAEVTWMSKDTKKQVQLKLDDIGVKIGHQQKFDDYAGLVIKKDDLLGNVQRTRLYHYQKELEQVGKPVDPDAWEMLPQNVNAYYSSQLNEIVFPAAIIQQPYFDLEADLAVNYGAIGAVIAHEIGHAFDDRGSRVDKKGRGADPWDQSDRKEYEKRGKALIEQYEKYDAVIGHKVNGKLNIGENISDNLGLAVAYRAYKLSLKGQSAPVIDGFTGDQRFYMGWAQVWRSKSTPEYILNHLKSAAHSPSHVRGNAAVRNHAAFYEAFNIQEGDQMYLPPKDRIVMW
jgi:putative endopeptidase